MEWICIPLHCESAIWLDWNFALWECHMTGSEKNSNRMNTYTISCPVAFGPSSQFCFLGQWYKGWSLNVIIHSVILGIFRIDTRMDHWTKSVTFDTCFSFDLCGAKQRSTTTASLPLFFSQHAALRFLRWRTSKAILDTNAVQASEGEYATFQLLQMLRFEQQI